MSEAGGADKKSAGPLVSEMDQSLSPTLSLPKTATEDRNRNRNVAGDKPYSIFAYREKWLIVSIASCAALFSPLTANIYFPAIPVISRAFHKDVEFINLTVTMYMVMQGLCTPFESPSLFRLPAIIFTLAPMIWGTLSDRWGRRPIMFACLATLSLSCVGLALIPTSAYWLLMLLRCLQAAGSASTIALGAGIIADLATPAERGGFFGIFGFGPLVGPCIGPVIGGALAQGLGWRSIFWFLCIGSAICGLALFLFLPETLRAIVGDGSIPAGWIYMPPIPVIGRHCGMNESNDLPPRRPFTNPLRMFTYPDVIVLLTLHGTLYAVMYGVTASLSVIFEKVYPYLTQTNLGLCFLAMGAGMLIGTLFSGKLIDTSYRKIRDDLIRQARIDTEKVIDPKAFEKDPSFPIEKARLHLLPPIVLVYATCVIGYGWSLQSRATIAVPLILLFIIGLTAITIMNAIQTLLVDLVPSQGSSITACTNVVRCSMGAGMVSVINPILVALDDGWTYVLLGGLCVLVSPLLYAEVRWGPVWREQRRRVQHSTANMESSAKA
ncbi:MFS general substrate transporter [Russula compacta]|nr:MFS general substrate transporter [Russula compacta]